MSFGLLSEKKFCLSIRVEQTWLIVCLKIDIKEKKTEWKKCVDVICLIEARWNCNSSRNVGNITISVLYITSKGNHL